jgi:hypothetical protein
MLNTTRLQSWEHGLQTGLSLRGTSISIGSKMDWPRHLDSYSDGSVVDCGLGSILSEREDLVFALSSTAWNAARWLHSRGKRFHTLRLNPN